MKREDYWAARGYSLDVLENAPYIITILGSDGMIGYLNNSFQKALGFDPDQWIGRKVDDLIHPDDAPAFKEVCDRLLLDGENETVVLRVSHSEWGWRWMECHGRKVETMDGVAELAFYAMDITEYHDAESALELANKKLNILGSATRHDVLNSLTGLFGYLELAESKSTDETVLKYIRKARGASDIVRKQMEFTKLYQEIGAKRPEWVKVGETINRVLLSVQLNNVAIAVNVNALEIYADPMVEKAFYNILENAMRHGESVRRIEVGLAQSGYNLIIFFKDDGKGIPTAEKDLIFKRGYGKNTGYGLYMAREVLGITGLTIIENGEPGKGARFEITIPPGKFRR